MSRLVIIFAMFLAVSAFSDRPVQCSTGGCSGQLCVNAAQEPMASTCEWQPSYACYGQHSVCEAQADDTCGWTPNAALEQCLAENQKGIPRNGVTFQ